MFAMNDAAFSHRRLLTILLWLLVICVSAHFLHDLQPGHGDLLGVKASFCSQMIHIGLLLGIAPVVILVVFIIKAVFPLRLFPLFAVVSVPIPPPIH